MSNEVSQAYRDAANRVRSLAKRESPRGQYPEAQAARMVTERFDELADELDDLAIEEDKQGPPDGYSWGSRESSARLTGMVCDVLGDVTSVRRGASEDQMLEACRGLVDEVQRLRASSGAEPVPPEVHECGWQWRPVAEDTAFAPPFGTIRVCRGCGCLVAGGPTSCSRCAAHAGPPEHPWQPHVFHPAGMPSGCVVEGCDAERPAEDWLDPSKTTGAEVDAELRRLGADPEAIGARGAALVERLTGKDPGNHAGPAAERVAGIDRCRAALTPTPKETP